MPTPKGQIKCGRVEGAADGMVHFETEGGERFEITNLFSVEVEQMDRSASMYELWPREPIGFRIRMEARQQTESVHDVERDYDYDADAEEIYEPPALENPLQLPAPKE